jgi:hypothetical protein
MTAMQQNIDDSGVRLRKGGSYVLLGLSALTLMIPNLPDLPRWILFGILFVAGAFMRFEAEKRWCLLRACGLRTPK